MRERLRDRIARTAVRHDGGEFEMRMARDEAQQLARDIARAAEHEGRDRRAHLRRPQADGRDHRNRRAPRRSLSALNAGTCICS